MSACVFVGIVAGSVYAVTIETVPVGNPGNAGELSGGRVGPYNYGAERVCGAVDYEYNIGKYEVIAAQYTEFLNAVARTDTCGLYNIWMADMSMDGCGIMRSGSSGAYRYSVAADWANRPVNQVNFWNACRFANWLHNGQPSGDQGPSTTEDGAYTLNGIRSGGWNVQRNSNCAWAIRGGSTADPDYALSAAFRDQYLASECGSNKGFRVVQLPEPATLVMLLAGVIAVRRRSRSLRF